MSDGPPEQLNKRYSREIKEEVIKCAREGKNWSQRAKELGVRHQAAYYWVSSAHRHRPVKPKGSGEAKKQAGVKGPQYQVNPAVVGYVCNLFENDPKITLAQICKKLNEDIGVTVAQSTAHKYLRGMVFSRSKYPPADSSKLESKEETKQYISEIRRHMQEGREIIWIGESQPYLTCKLSISYRVNA